MLCVAAVLVAKRGRFGWAGLLLGLAIVNKEWALLAVGPVVVALPARRWRAILVASAVAGVFYAPLVVAALTAPAGGGILALGKTGTIFQPWQLWWFLGASGHVVRDTFGVVLIGYRAAPSWLSRVPHPLIILLSVPLTVLAERRGGARVRSGEPADTDALLLLVGLLLMHCVLDPWDTVYYPLPFIVALAAWESLKFNRPPAFALAATVLTWAIFEQLPTRVSPDLESVAFLLVALPSLAAIGFALYSPGSRLLASRGEHQPQTSTAASMAQHR